ncbi:MAG: hypothetical protein GY930_05195 [bacterium]|nr:hypothetical protein [bacterium]
MKNQRKQDLRKRLDRLQRMDAKERNEKLDRTKRLREIMADVYSRMDAETKKRVDAMSPSEKSNLLGRLALEEARSRSREVRLVLGSKGEEGEVGKGPGRKESKAMHEEFLREAHKRLQAHVEKNGLPKGVSQKEWDEFQKLEGRKFGRKLRMLSDKHPELVEIVGPPPGRKTISREHWELHEAMRLPQGEHMRMLGPKKGHGSKEEMASRRKRVLRVLRKHGLPEEDQKQVKALTDREFMEWIRQRIGPRRGPGGEEGKGRRPRPGQGPEGRPRMGPDRRPPMDGDGRRPQGRPDRSRGPGLGPHPKRPRPPKDRLKKGPKEKHKDPSMDRSSTV